MEERVAYQIPNLIQASSYVDVPFPDGSLAFRIDLERMVIEIQERGKKHYFDVRAIYQGAMDKSP